MGWLLVGAFAPELAPFDEPSEALFQSGSRSALGVGVVATAATLARQLAVSLPEGVIFSGTGGVYPGAPFCVGDVVVADRVCWVDGATAEGRSAMPELMPQSVQAPRVLREALVRAGAAAADVATVPSVTTDDVLAQRLASFTSCTVEHLEAFAVGVACEQAGVAWAVVLGLANRVGATGRQEWLANHHRAAAQAALVVRAAWDLDAATFR